MSYSKEQDFSVVLGRVHQNIIKKMKKEQAAAEAKELQKILSEIKHTVTQLDKAGSPDPVAKGIRKEYVNIINKACEKLNTRGQKKLSPGALFFRQHSIKHTDESDNIFEEELAALFSAVAEARTKQSFDFNIFLSGTEGASLKAVDDLSKETKQQCVQILQDVEQELLGKAKTKQIQAEKSQKVDVDGLPTSLNLTFSKKMPNISRLAELLKDATFSAKSYSTHSYHKTGINKHISSLQLGLGETNLYKAITGTLSEIYKTTRHQRDIFYRGMQILTYTKNTPSETAENVKKHFSHMRFIYELRGSGLLDASGGLRTAKYIIFNDPTSEAIYVKDTASLILEELGSSTYDDKLFGKISIAARKVNSNKD